MSQAVMSRPFHDDQSKAGAGRLTINTSSSRSTSPGSSLAPGSSRPASTRATVRPVLSVALEASDRPTHGAFDNGTSQRLPQLGQFHESGVLTCPGSRIGKMILPPPGFEHLEPKVGLICAGTASITPTPFTADVAGGLLGDAEVGEPLPALGSPELPTIGSLGHKTLSCRPCAFFHRMGCENGIHCHFCHLCEPGEKRRRQKEKKEQMQQCNLVPSRQEAVAEGHVTDMPTLLQSPPFQTNVQPLLDITCHTSKSPLSCVPMQLDHKILSTTAYDVRNTFIDTGRFIHERTILSCPASKVGRMRVPKPLELDDDAETAAPLVTPQLWPSTPFSRPATLPTTPIETEMSRYATDALMREEALRQLHAVVQHSAMPGHGISVVPAPPNVPAPDLLPSVHPPPPPPPQATAPDVFAQLQGDAAASSRKNSVASILRIADVIGEPSSIMRNSSPETRPKIPSMGSAGHVQGNCKPCAFFHKDGCENGAMCPFCHICEQGEKKRRQKLKKTQLQSMKRQLMHLPLDGLTH